jgi:hypothetical protein
MQLGQTANEVSMRCSSLYSTAIQVIDLETRQVKATIAMPHKLAVGRVRSLARGVRQPAIPEACRGRIWVNLTLCPVNDMPHTNSRRLEVIGNQ